VTEIENLAQSGFALVAADYARFDGDVARNLRAKRAAITLQNLVDMLFQLGEHRRVGNYRVLDNRRESAAKLAVGKSAQQVGICDHQARRVERTNEIFALGKIHAGFSTDRAVDLSHESRGNVN